MRNLVIGDIHGCLQAFELLLQSMSVQPGDTLITLGDYIDRGPDSKGVLDRLLALRQSNNVIPLLGNHEIMMLEARHDPAYQMFWCQVGGDTTLESYGDGDVAGTLEDVPEAHWAFLSGDCVRYYETSRHFFVHANADPELALADQSEQMLFWTRFENPPPHSSGKIMICGHTSQRTGLPVNLGHAICLDTRIYDGGWLTGMDLASGKLWQTDQVGRQRESHIDDFA